MKKHRFFIKKQYSFVKKFKLIPKGPMDQFFEFIDKFKKARSSKDASKKKKVKKGLNITLIVSLIFVFIILGLIVYFVMLLQSIPPTQPPTPDLTVFVPRVVYGQYGTIFDKGDALWLHVILFPINVDEISLDIFPLSSDSIDIVPNLYVLKSGLFDTSESSFFDFYNSLKFIGFERGFNVELINMNELDKVPPGSFIVIPSGRFPFELAFKLEDLAKRKVNVLYIGGVPSENAVDLSGNLISLPKDYDPMTVYSTSIRHTNLKPINLKIRSAVYELAGSTKIKGAASLVSYKKKYDENGGLFIVLPATLEEGWKTPDDAANDVISVILDPSIVLHPKRLKPSTMELQKDTRDVIIENNNNLPFGKYILFFTGRSASTSKVSSYLHTYYFYNDSEGYMYPTSGPSFLSMDLSKKPITFNYKIKGQGKKTLKLVVYNSAGKVVDTKILDVFLGDEGNFKYYNENLTEGVYLFAIKDNSRVLVKTILQISPLSIKLKPDFDLAKFTFEFYVGDKKAVIDEVKVYYNGKEYTDKKVSSFTIDLSSDFGGKAPSGRYYFTVVSGRVKKQLSAYNPPKTAIGRIIFGNPINMALLILSTIIFIIGSFIKPKMDTRLYIDIPDFPPMEKLKITISASEVLEVIEDVNKYYKWKYTPLKTSEIKMGFRRIIRNGNPIIISDFNLEYILDEMVEKGLLKKVLDYYGIPEWEKKSGFSIEELALFRKLRDVCVEHAIPFSQLMKKKFNVKIKLMFKDNFVIFFTPNKEFLPVMRKALSLVKESQVILLTLTDDEKELLLDYTFQSGKEVSLFRHYIERGLITIMTVYEFEAMVNELVI